MKIYHEVACIVDYNGELVGYVMKKGNVTENAKWMLASLEQFDKTVRDSKVQYFECIGGKSELSYTEEELQIISMVGTSPCSNFDEYFAKDIHLRQDYIDLVTDKGYSYVFPLSVRQVPIVGNLITFGVFAKDTKVVANIVRKCISGTIFEELNSLSASWGSINNFTFSVSETVIREGYLFTGNEDNMIFDSSNLARLSNILDDSCSQYIQYTDMPRDDELDALCNLIDGWNKSTRG